LKVRQPATARNVDRGRPQSAHTEISRTLRLHKAGTVATLSTICGITVLATVGLVVGLDSFTHRTAASGSALSELRMAIVSLGAWLFCCHYLWRCYRCSVRTERSLLRQLTVLEQTREALAIEQRVLKREERAAAGMTSNGKSSSASARKRNRSKNPQLSSQPEVGSTNNVVNIESYRRV
jgi:hypothetical protein